jgi:hypothetical protein
MLNPDFREILSGFIAGKVEFLVVGAYALAVHGLPRATGDLDLWISPTQPNARRVWRALANFGAALDAVTEEDFSVPDTVVQIGRAPRRVDVLTAIDGVEFGAAWDDRVMVEIEGMTLPVLSREHLIINKRASGRPQDIADAERLEGGAGR